MKCQDVVHYMRSRGGFILFEYEGKAKRYLYYEFQEAYRLFKKECGLKRARLVRDDHPSTYGFMY